MVVVGAEETGGRGDRWVGQVDLKRQEDGDGGRDTKRLSNRHKDNCCTEAKGVRGIESMNTLPSVCSFMCVRAVKQLCVWGTNAADGSSFHTQTNGCFSVLVRC